MSRPGCLVRRSAASHQALAIAAVSVRLLVGIVIVAGLTLPVWAAQPPGFPPATEPAAVTLTLSRGNTAGRPAERIQPASALHAVIASGIAALDGWTSFETPRLATTDVPFGTHADYYFDPEFLPGSDRIVWQNLKTNEIWLAHVDFKTGAWSNSGREQFVGVGASILPTLLPDGSLARPGLQGPEWGNSQNGPDVFYNVLDDQQRFQINKYNLLDQSTMRLSADDRARGCSLIHASTTVTDAVPYYSFANRIGTAASSLPAWSAGTTQPQQVIPADGLSVVESFRWITGTTLVTTGIADSQGRLQAAVYDVAQRRRTQLTFDDGNKSELHISESAGAGFTQFLCAVDDRALAVYVKQRDQFVRERTIQPPFAGHVNDWRVYSPELVERSGRTYVTYMAGVGPAARPSWIYLAAVDGPVWQQRISSPQPEWRFDPEPVSGDNGLFVYYWTPNRLQPILRLITVPLP